MKQIPILFSTQMVQAILEGRKTQTRRIIKHHAHGIVKGSDICGYTYLPESNTALFNGPDYPDGPDDEVKCPYGKPGDLFYVREEHYAFGEWVKNGKTKKGRQRWRFVRHIDADITFKKPGTVMSNSYRKPAWYKRLARFMPKSAARVWLVNKNIRVEPVQAASDKDIRAEGAAELGCVTHRLNWENLWTKVNGAESWKNNPWVWVVEFKLIEKPL